MPETVTGGRLPIKLILPKQGKERAVLGGGGPPVPFRLVDQEYRARLSHQVDAIKRTSMPQLRRVGSVPVRVKLIPKATAKSHRPETLFAPDSCPIIGAGALGELFVKATEAGLSRLGNTILGDDSKRALKELSEIEFIEPVTPQFRRRGEDALAILKNSPRRARGFLTRVRLFDYGDDESQALLVADFLKACQTHSLPVSTDGYSPASFVFAVECSSTNDVELLSNVVGVRALTNMPTVRTLKPQAINAKLLPGGLPKRAAEQDVPVVVVVDSGISDDIPGLTSWIVGRHTDVAPEYRNTTHGTFIAGLVCWGSQLNPSLANVDDNPCAVFDLQVLPNDDPAVGDTDDLSESEFLQSLEAALKIHANRLKVWNLSIGTNELCSLDEFSAFGEQLDDLQEKYQVSFVVSAGNYHTPPLLPYPRQGKQRSAGRITSPADTVLGLTVGSITHVDYAKNGPKTNHPSPFSRHGAGPNHIIKPDLVHYGGSCSLDLQQSSGIRSLHNGGSAEDLGTSFATPLVARKLAQIFHSITPSPSPVLARALLVHHARDPRSSGRVPDGEENYYGFGIPTPPPYCLECTPYSATLVFEDQLRPGYFLEWDDFPYPRSLRRNGRYFGEVGMTVAFAPSRGARWGTEYCETHIDAHFGVYYSQRARETGNLSTKFKGLVPPEHKNPGQLYESYQVEHLRKWAPVRTYYGNLNPDGERGDRWRLMVRLLTRHDAGQSAVRPQPFSLIITICDPTQEVPVYDEVAQILRTRFKAENLAIRAASHVRVRRDDE